MADNDKKFIEDYERFWIQKQKGELRLATLTEWIEDEANHYIFLWKLQMRIDTFKKNKRVLWSFMTVVYVMALDAHNRYYKRTTPYIWKNE